MTYEADPLGLVMRATLLERLPALVAESCAWAVGLSDLPYVTRRDGRVAVTADTLGARAETGLPMTSDADARLELGEAVPGTFRDLLGALTPDGRLHADRFDAEVLTPFVLQTCVEAVQHVRRTAPEALEELFFDLGEDGHDVVAVVRAAEWEAPLTTEAEQLVLAALGDLPLLEVEIEGLPLSLVRAAESLARAAAPPADDPVPRPLGDPLAGAVFLAEEALQAAGFPQPVPSSYAEELVEVLLEEGLQPDELPQILLRLPVEPDTADDVRGILAAREV